MVLYCKFNCHKYKVIKNGGKSRYKNGQSYCKHCTIYIKWEGIFCPCCGGRLKKSSSRIKNKVYERIC